jgi:hypothetical protein
MKLRKELDFLTARFKDNKDAITDHMNKLRIKQEYNDLATRLSWDCFYAFTTNEYRMGLYDRYNDLHDNHIDTAVKQALKNVMGVITA